MAKLAFFFPLTALHDPLRGILIPIFLTGLSLQRQTAQHVVGRVLEHLSYVLRSGPTFLPKL